jgi:hypothetical protein
VTPAAVWSALASLQGLGLVAPDEDAHVSLAA